MASTLASKTFPGFSSIYSLGEVGDSVAFRGKFPLSVDPVAFTRVETIPPGPVAVRWAMGRRKPSDIIFTTDAIPVLMSDRVLGILEAGKFSGWQAYPIDLFGKDGVRIPGYRGLAMHGRCGPIDYSRAVKLDKIMPGGVIPARYGLYFDPATWDGSDLFMSTDNSGWIFMVEAVKRALEEAKVTNVRFTALDEQEVPESE